MQASGLLGNTNALKYKTQEELQAGINSYFEDCDKREKPYTMSGLALSLGIDRTTLIRYGDRDSYATLIKEAKQKVECQLEENALTNKANATFTIFNLKNNYGWKDKVEIESEKSNGVLTELAEALKNVKNNK